MKSIQGATGDAFSSFKLLGTIEILSDDDGCTLIQDAVLDKTIYLRAKSKSLAATGPNATRAGESLSLLHGPRSLIEQPPRP